MRGGAPERANRVGCIVARMGEGGVAECRVRMGAFEETVRGKAVAEDAHDCFKVPLYIANESGSRPRQVSEHCAYFYVSQAANICSLMKLAHAETK